MARVATPLAGATKLMVSLCQSLESALIGLDSPDQSVSSDDGDPRPFRGDRVYRLRVTLKVVAAARFENHRLLNLIAQRCGVEARKDHFKRAPASPGDAPIDCDPGELVETDRPIELIQPFYSIHLKPAVPDQDPAACAPGRIAVINSIQAALARSKCPASSARRSVPHSAENALSPVYQSWLKTATGLGDQVLFGQKFRYGEHRLGVVSGEGLQSLETAVR